MKFGMPDSLKFLDLQHRLGLPRFATVGLVEGIIHFAAANADDGDLSRFQPDAIAEWLGWQGSPDDMVEAMVKTGWLNRGNSGLRITDWFDLAGPTIADRWRKRSRQAHTRKVYGGAGDSGHAGAKTIPGHSGKVPANHATAATAAPSDAANTLDFTVDQQVLAPTIKPARTRASKGLSDAGKRAGRSAPGYKSWSRADLEASVSEHNKDGLLTKAEAAQFVDYWCEPSTAGVERFKLQDAWSTRLRMQTALRIVYMKQRKADMASAGRAEPQGQPRRPAGREAW